MAATRSKSPSKRTKDAQVEDAPVAVKKSTLASETNKGTNMSDITSVIEFSEDIATAEAVPPLPVGEYPAEIRAATKKTSGAGNDYGAVQFFIAPESYPADYTDGDPDGTLLTYNRVSLEDSPRGRHRLRKFIEAIGAKAGTKIDLNDWVGLTATVAVGHSEWEGETRAEVQKVVAA